MEARLTSAFNSCLETSIANATDKDMLTLIQTFIKFSEERNENDSHFNHQLENSVASYFWKVLLSKDVPLTWKNNIGRALIIDSLRESCVISTDLIFNVIKSSGKVEACGECVASINQLINSEPEPREKTINSDELLMEILIALSFGLLDAYSKTNFADKLNASWIECHRAGNSATETLLCSHILRYIIIKYSFGYRVSFHTLPLIVTCLRHIDPSYSGHFEIRDLFDVLVANWCSHEPGVANITTDRYLSALLEDRRTNETIYFRLCNMLNSDWPSKGVVKSIPTLLKHRKLSQLFEDCPLLLEKLLKQLSFNFSASVASCALKSIFKCASDKGEENSIDKIRSCIENSIIKRHTTVNEECGFKFIHSCVISLCSNLPNLADQLLKVICASLEVPSIGSAYRDYLLHLWAGTTQAMITNDNQTPRDEIMYSALLLECLQHPDDTTRLMALSQLPQLASTDARTFLLYFLPALSANFSISSTASRFLLTECVGNTLHRFIERVLANHKQILAYYSSEEESRCFSEASIQCLPDVTLPQIFILKTSEKAACSSGSDEIPILIRNFELLFKLIHHLRTSDCLFPGSCYQRQKITLDLLDTVLDRFSGNIRAYKKAGFTKDTQARLKMIMKLSCQAAGWSYGDDINMSRWLVEALLTCNKSLYPQIINTLDKHFTACLPMDYVMKLQQIAIQLCNSPQTDRYSAGAYLLFHLCTRYSFSTENAQSVEEFFINTLNSHLNEAGRQSILHMAAKNTGHGFFMCLDLILSKAYNGNFEMVSSSRIASLFDICKQNIGNMMAIMGNSLTDNKAAASFEELGKSIMSAAFSDTDCENDDVNSTARLPVEFQKVLSWSWHSIKLATNLLVTWSSCNIEDARFLEVGHLLFKILTQSRHRGTIESVNASFQKYLNALISFTYENKESNFDFMRQFPETLVRQCVDIVTDNAYSVTRRSAGLPYILTSLLVAVNRGRQRQNRLLNMVIVELINIASVESEDSRNQDPPAVHALNLLKALVRETGLANAITRYLTNLIGCSLSGFSSNQWSVRNASLQLFGSLVIKLLGPENQPPPSSMEFFSSYPNIWPQLEKFLMKFFVSSSTNNQSTNGRDIIQEQTCLPVLALLSRLGAYPALVVRHESFRYENANLRMVVLLRNYFSSPVMAIRNLAAKATLSFLSMDSDSVENSSRYITDQLTSVMTCATNQVKVENNVVHANFYLARIFYEKLYQTGGVSSDSIVLPEIERLFNYVLHIVNDKVSNWYMAGQVVHLIYLLVTNFTEVIQLDSVKIRTEELKTKAHESCCNAIIHSEFLVVLHRLHYYLTEDIAPFSSNCCPGISILMQQSQFQICISQHAEELLQFFLVAEESESIRGILHFIYNQVNRLQENDSPSATLRFRHHVNRLDQFYLLKSCTDKINALYYREQLVGNTVNRMAFRVVAWLFPQALSIIKRQEEFNEASNSGWLIATANRLVDWMISLCETNIDLTREDGLKSGCLLWSTNEVNSEEKKNNDDIVWLLLKSDTKQKLLTSMVNLLLDECEEVRNCAIRLFHRILSNQLVNERAPSIPFTNHTVLLRYLVEHLSDMIRLDFQPCDWLLSLWLSQEKALERILDYSLSSNYSEDLFEPEESNVFREYRLLIELCFAGFCSLMKKDLVCSACKERLKTVSIKDEYSPYLSESSWQINSNNVMSVNVLTASRSLHISLMLRTKFTERSNAFS